jgi:hypothetical protein
MEFKYKIIFTILIIVVVVSCKKNSGCTESKGINVLPFPIGYENYFLGISSSPKNLKSNNGLTDVVNFYSNTNSYGGFDYNQDPITCKQNVGLSRFFWLTQTLYKQYIDGEICLVQNGDLNLLLKIEYNDTISKFRETWNILKSLNNSTKPFKTFFNNSSFYQDDGDSVYSELTDFSEIDSIVFLNKTYKNVFHIINRQALLRGDKFSITDIYIDKLIGVISYKQKNGQIWNIEYQ